MERSAVTQAKARLAAATTALESVARATDFHEMKANWTVFLASSHAVYNKLERGARHFPNSHAWMRAKTVERENDPLLKYMHAARSADEHDIVELTEDRLSQVMVSGTGRFVDTTDGAGAEIIVETFDGKPFAFVREHLGLGPVPQGRKKPAIDPPTTHQGKAIENGSAFAIGRLAVAYLEGMLSEAEKLVPPT